MTASRRFLYGETSRMHCSGVILAHSSTQTVFKSWKFPGPLLWSSVLSIDFQLDSSQVIGWAILAALFSFSETNWEFPWLFIVLLKCPPSFHLHHPGRWQQIFIKNVSVHFSIHPSFNCVKFASTVCWKAAPHHDVPTSKLHCWDDVQCHLSSKHGVHYGIQRVQICSHLTRLYSPSISQACPNVVLQTLNEL